MGSPPASDDEDVPSSRTASSEEEEDADGDGDGED